MLTNYFEYLGLQLMSNLIHTPFGKDKVETSFAKIISKILLNNTIPRWERNLHKTCFLNELNKFRITVSSFVSEFMLAAMSKKEGFNVEFPIKVDSEKVCDITRLIQSRS